MRVRFAGQQFARAFSDAFGSLASQKPAMIQEESQHVQILSADLPTQKEVATQPTI